ncbi:hypothetical protein DID75_02530 [Candidatus Marinamargulisbacteria bacterium SCGC AG-410-N11]|nr:hypothetical protein DID75_02530 [Candidatus Marinamargulisbacteria bacterium SCGC AG-410-N11]
MYKHLACKQQMIVFSDNSLHSDLRVAIKNGEISEQDYANYLNDLSSVVKKLDFGSLSQQNKITEELLEEVDQLLLDTSVILTTEQDIDDGYTADSDSNESSIDLLDNKIELFDNKNESTLSKSQIVTELDLFKDFYFDKVIQLSDKNITKADLLMTDQECYQQWSILDMINAIIKQHCKIGSETRRIMSNLKATIKQSDQQTDVKFIQLLNRYTNYLTNFKKKKKINLVISSGRCKNTSRRIVLQYKIFEKIFTYFYMKLAKNPNLGDVLQTISKAKSTFLYP